MHHCVLKNTRPSHPNASRLGRLAHSGQPPRSTVMPAGAVALQCHGPSVHHRRSWRLPGVSEPAEAGRMGVAGTGVLENAVMHDDGAVRTEHGGEQWARQSMSEAANEL